MEPVANPSGGATDALLTASPPFGAENSRGSAHLSADGHDETAECIELQRIESDEPAPPTGTGRSTSVALDLRNAVRSVARLTKRLSTGLGSRRGSDNSTLATTSSPFVELTSSEVFEATAQAEAHRGYKELVDFFNGIGISLAESEVYAKRLVEDFHIRGPEDLEGLTPKQLLAYNIPYSIHRNEIAYAFPRLGTHAELIQRVTLMIWFICVVSIGMVYQRLLCTGGIPYDCASIDHPEDQLDVVNTIILVYEKSLLLFFLGQIGRYQLTRWYFYVVFFGIFPLFGYLGSIYPDVYLNSSHLQYSLQSLFTTRVWVLIGVVGTLILFLVIVHFYLAYRHSVGFMVLYLTTLGFIVFMIFALYALVSSTSIFYIHHWFIFWVLSIFTRFNHPLSVISLGLCVGIFVQGAAAYGANTVAFV